MFLSRWFGPSLYRGTGSLAASLSRDPGPLAATIGLDTALLASSLRLFSSTAILPGSGPPCKMWRLPELTPSAVWPNYKEHLTHHKHRRQQYWHTYGVQKQSLLRCVDNSSLGREAMAQGKPPRIIHVYSEKHARKRHGAHGKLGDRVMVAVLGQKRKGIIVGLKAKQTHGIPRYDTNNIVLIDENGNPSGNRILAPLPNCIRPELKQASDPKKADYTKLFAIASKWV